MAPGLAAAVGLGPVTTTIISIVQLRRDLGLHPFAPPLPRALAGARVVSLGLLNTLPLLIALPRWLELFGFLTALLLGMWVSARFGLGPTDNAFLGKTARQLRR